MAELAAITAQEKEPCICNWRFIQGSQAKTGSHHRNDCPRYSIWQLGDGKHKQDISKEDSNID